MADDHTGFGSVARDVLEEVSDLFPNRTVAYFSLRRPEPWRVGDEGAANHTGHAWTRNALSQGLSLGRILDLVDMYVPMEAPVEYERGWPYLRSCPHSAFHSGAVLAAALDSSTLVYRLTGATSTLGPPLGGLKMSDLAQLMQGTRSKLVAAHMRLPAPALPADAQALSELEDARLQHAGHAAELVAEEARKGHLLT